MLYYHFGSKEGLFVGLLREGLETLEAEVKKALAEAPTAAEKVSAYCRVHLTVQRRFAEHRRIAEALIATAIGLMVALPAVIAFNYLRSIIKNLFSRCEAVGDMLVAFMKHGQALAPATPSRDGPSSSASQSD